MPDQQHIYISNNQTNQGCLGGCGSAIAVVLVVGLAVQYWYISAAVALIAVGAGVWYWRQQQQQVATAPVTPEIAAASGDCANCGQPVSGNFCGHCGASAGRTCAGCGMRGLLSPYCPECGSATYAPPAPT